METKFPITERVFFLQTLLRKTTPHAETIKDESENVKLVVVERTEYQPFFTYIFESHTKGGGGGGGSSSSSGSSSELRSNISEVKAADIQRHTHLSLKLIKEQPAWSSARKAAGPLWI